VERVQAPKLIAVSLRLQYPRNDPEVIACLASRRCCGTRGLGGRGVGIEFGIHGHGVHGRAAAALVLDGLHGVLLEAERTYQATYYHAGRCPIETLVYTIHGVCQVSCPCEVPTFADSAKVGTSLCLKTLAKVAPW